MAAIAISNTAAAGAEQISGDVLSFCEVVGGRSQWTSSSSSSSTDDDADDDDDDDDDVSSESLSESFHSY